MSSYIVIKKSETKTAIITLCNDGIVRALFKKDSEISVEDIKENYKAINEVVKANYFSFLYSTESNNIIYTPEALKYSRENTSTAFPKICVAVVVKSLAHKLIANFLSRLFVRDFPYKTFTIYHEAEEWCLNLYQKHQHNPKKPNSYSNVI